MKEWNAPEIIELGVENTENHLIGVGSDDVHVTAPCGYTFNGKS